jgi:hypothetical protein
MTNHTLDTRSHNRCVKGPLSQTVTSSPFQVEQPRSTDHGVRGYTHLSLHISSCNLLMTLASSSLL